MGTRKVYIDFIDGNGYIDISNFVKYDTLSIQESAFNDTYHAAQNTCSFSIIYDASIYTKIISATGNLPIRIYDQRNNAALHTEDDKPILTEDGIRLLVESSVVAPVFTGHIPPKSSREYNGILNNTIIKINATDNLDYMDIPAGDIIYANCAVMNPTDPTNSIVHRLALAAGWTSPMVSSTSIPTVIPRFAPPEENTSIRSILDTLLYEYGYTLFLDENNNVAPIQWDVAIPSGTIPEFNEDNIIDEISIENSINKYDGVKVVYYDMNYIDDMRLYRDSNCGYASDGTFAGYSIPNNTDYPPAADAIDETTGVKQVVYQEYTDDAIKYATNKAIQQNLDYNYKNYSSDFTSIIATENHYVDRRFENPITVVTETFANKKCRLLYRNTTGSPVLLYFNDVYATIWYKSVERTAVKDLVTTPSDVNSYTSSYIYSKTIGDALTLALAAQYKAGLKNYEMTSEKDFHCGSLVRIILSEEGTNIYALIKSKAWDEKNELYTYSCVLYNPTRETLTSQMVVDVGTVNATESYTSIHSIGTPEAIQGAIDTKNTVFATIALAQSSAIIGDIFLDSGLMYQCTVAAGDITIANSTRLTVKNFGKLASAPASDMVANDTYYNTTNETQYYYNGVAWVAAANSPTLIVTAYTPKYLGRYLDSHPSSYKNGDWWLVYGVATSSITRGFWYSNNGTPTLVSALSSEAQRMYKASGLEDVLYASNNEYALNSEGVYDPVTIYGVSTMEFLAVNQAFIQKLMTKELQLQTGGKLYSGVGAYDDVSTPIFLGSDGKMSLGNKLTFDGSNLNVNGTIDTDTAYMKADLQVVGQEYLKVPTYISFDLYGTDVATTMANIDALMNTNGVQLYDTENYAADKRVYCSVISNDPTNKIVLYYAEGSTHICNVIDRYTQAGVVRYDIGICYYTPFISGNIREGGTYRNFISNGAYVHPITPESNKLSVTFTVSGITTYGSQYVEGCFTARRGVHQRRRGLLGNKDIGFATQDDLFQFASYIYRQRGTSTGTAYYTIACSVELEDTRKFIGCIFHTSSTRIDVSYGTTMLSCISGNTNAINIRFLYI